MFYELLKDKTIGRSTPSKKVADLLGLKLETDKEIVYGYNGKRYLKGKEPKIPAEYQNEQIRSRRQERYKAESDALMFDYLEALARGDKDVDDKKKQWLDSKDNIREELAYIGDK